MLSPQQNTTTKVLELFSFLLSTSLKTYNITNIFVSFSNGNQPLQTLILIAQDTSTYVNDFAWKTIGGAIAAKIQKPIWSCIMPDWSIDRKIGHLFMRSIAKTELYITYQIEQEKPAEIQGTVCPAIGNKAIFNTHQHT